MQILHVSREVGVKDSQVPLLGKIAASDSPSHTDTYLRTSLTSLETNACTYKHSIRSVVPCEGGFMSSD